MQKLPTEIIGRICYFSNLKTHNALRATCTSVRLYVPLLKVVKFKSYKVLVSRYRLEFDFCKDYYADDFENIRVKEDMERKRVFQERIHLNISHKSLNMEQVIFIVFV